ncbi:MAG TPA: hypothetical protein ENF16_05905, partial [Bacteroidetes bacterium]|nr:hypothetical protein [Bacteroidota bacterium]
MQKRTKGQFTFTETNQESSMRSSFTKFVKALIVITVLGHVIPVSGADSWTEKLRWKGDFRYRHEFIDEEDKEQRNRHRIRARVGLVAEAMEDVNVIFQISSGFPDPVSNNQTLDDGFSTKSVGIDLAYFHWEPVFAEGLKAQGGKFKNPWYKPGKSELIWDSDWNPEGLFASYATKWGNVSPFVRTGLFWVDERKTDDDALLLGGQGGLTLDIPGGEYRMTFGGGFFTYTHTKASETFVDSEDSFGNTVDADGSYATGFDIIEMFIEISGQVQKVPVTVMGDYTSNSGADRDEIGYLFGLRAGKVNKAGAVSGRYIYREVQKDAVLGAYTDSD